MATIKKPRKSPRTKDIRQAQFLAAYRECGSVRISAAVARVHRSRHYRWLEDDAAYAQSFEDAHADAIEALEAEVRRRAVLGVEEPVIYQGALCYEPLRDKDGRPVLDDEGHVKFGSRPLTVRKPSDVLLMFLLKGLKPQTYRDNVTVEHTASAEVIRALQAGRERVAAAGRQESTP